MTRSLQHTLVSIWSLLLSFSSFAQVSPAVGVAMSDIGITVEELTHEYIIETSLPGTPGHLLVVLTWEGDPLEGSRTLDGAMFILDSNNHVIGLMEAPLSWYDIEGPYRLGHIEPDLAKYYVTPDRRAFGLRTMWYGASRYSISNEEYLCLYEHRGDEIVEILHNHITYNQSGEYNPYGNSHYTTSNTILIMKESKTGEYFNIESKTEIVTSTENDAGETIKSESATRRETLHYEDDGYRASDR